MNVKIRHEGDDEPDCLEEAPGVSESQGDNELDVYMGVSDFQLTEDGVTLFAPDVEGGIDVQGELVAAVDHLAYDDQSLQVALNDYRGLDKYDLTVFESDVFHRLNWYTDKDDEEGQ
jgi:hypothetical protein